jgi:N-acetylneuraminate synthase
MTYLEYKHRVEFQKPEYDEIDSYCKERGIAWSASPWDLVSLQFLQQYDVPYIKIPSAHLTNLDLIKASVATGKKVIASTGMSTLQEIDSAVEVLRGGEYALLHCNSTYPAPLKELNLKCIQTLKNRYGCEVGYSGHEFRLGTSVSAVYLGATIIERHITLDRTMWGTDQLSSIEPQGLIKLVKGIRELEIALGSGEKIVTKAEEQIRKKLRGI